MQEDSALGHAVAVQERAARAGFDWPDANGPLAKIEEETRELVREMRDAGSRKREAVQDEVGDLLFAVVNLARKLAIDPATALEGANEKFVRRFAAVKQLAAQRGLVMGQATLDELDELWDEIKGGQGQSL